VTEAAAAPKTSVAETVSALEQAKSDIAAALGVVTHETPAAEPVATKDEPEVKPEAVETVYPYATIQLCIVHMVRNSRNYVGWNKRKQVAADLRLVYSAATMNEAERALADFEDKWNNAYPPIARSWRNNWQRIMPFFDYPPEIRRIIYTTNAIESVNMSLRKVSKNRGSFPNDDAVIKLFYLALSNIAKKWSMPIKDWKPALNRFIIQFEERIPLRY